MLSCSLLAFAMAHSAMAQLSCELGEVRHLPDGGFAINTIRIVNEGDQSVSEWRAKLILDDSVMVSRFWGADIEYKGEFYQVDSTSYNGDLESGASTAFGVKGAGTLESAECIAISPDNASEPLEGIVTR